VKFRFWRNKSGDPELDTHGKKEIDDPKHAENVEALIIALADKQPSARKAAAEAMGRLPARAFVKPLITAIADKDNRVRWAAAKSLGKIGDARALKPMLKALQDKDSNVQRAAAWALGKMRDARAVYPLVAALEVPALNQSAAKALSRIGVSAVEPLMEVLKKGNKSIRPAAANTLVRIDNASVNPLVAALEETDSGVRKVAAQALESLGWQPANDRQRVRWALIRCQSKELATIGSAGSDLLLVALKDEDRGVRETAAKGLGEIKDNRAVEALVAALSDSDIRVRYEARLSLGKIGSPAVKSLLTALTHKDVHVRQGAVEALGYIADPQAVKPLVSILGDLKLQDEPVKALIRMGSAAVEQLAAALEDSDDNVRWRAVEALTKIGDSRVTRRLVGALNDRNWELRAEAAKALRSLGWEPVDEAQRALYDVICFISSATQLGAPLDYLVPRIFKSQRKMNREALGVLVDAMNGEDSRVRRAAAYALGEIRDASSVGPLVATFKGDTDRDVQWVAVQSLVKLGSIAIVPLEDAKKDTDLEVQRLAEWALRKIRGGM
jgi:HEAT repeat protein